MTTTHPAEVATKRPGLARQVWAGIVGMSLEMYDWQVYGIMSVYISAQVFSQEDPVSGLLSTFMIFAVGFFVRPVGGAIFGSFADRFGRKPGLILSMIMLGFGSLMIAFVPTHAMAGGWAAAILLAARLLQGLGVGGEQGAGVSFISEIAPEGKRALFNAFGYLGSTAAIILATLIGGLLPILFGPEGTAEWAWRIPFLLGALFTVYAVWMRRNIEDTELFSKRKAERSSDLRPLRLLLTRHWKETLLTIGIVAGGTFTYYAFALQYANLAFLSTGIQLGSAQLLSVIVLVVFAVLQPFFGWLSDKVGRRPIMLAGYGASLVLMWPCVLLLNGDPVQFVVLQLLALVPVAASIAVSNAALAELFPTEVRGLGVAFPYATSVALFGGTAPYMITLFAGADNLVGLATYGSVLLAISLVCVFLMRERSREPLR